MNYKNKIIVYQTNQDLPLEIRDRLPESAQDLDRAADNLAINLSKEAGKAHKVASSAVKMYSARTLSVLV